MAKECSICGQTIKMMDPKVHLQDGMIDVSCLKKLGLAASVLAVPLATANWAKQHTIAEVKNMVDNGDTVKSTDSARLQEIKSQFSAAGVSDLFGTRKEVNALPDILSPDEIVKYATSGIVDGNTILMVVTNTRVLFIDKGLVYGIKSTEIPLDMINSVNYEMGMLLGSISIVNGAVTTIVKNVVKTTAPQMVDTIKQARTAFMQPTIVTASVVEKSSANELREFKALLDDGILTQEEFDAKKKEILGL